MHWGFLCPFSPNKPGYFCFMYTQGQIVGSIAVELDQRFGKDLKRLRVGRSGSRLRNSRKVTHTKRRIMIEYFRYGQFVDMGVGRGQKFSKRSSRTINKLLGNSKSRKAKKWYSKNYRWAQLRLAERLVQNAGDNSLDALFKAIPDTIEFYG